MKLLPPGTCPWKCISTIHRTVGTRNDLILIGGGCVNGTWRIQRIYTTVDERKRPTIYQLEPWTVTHYAILPVPSETWTN